MLRKRHISFLLSVNQRNLFFIILSFKASVWSLNNLLGEKMDSKSQFGLFLNLKKVILERHRKVHNHGDLFEESTIKCSK